MSLPLAVYHSLVARRLNSSPTLNTTPNTHWTVLLTTPILTVSMPTYDYLEEVERVNTVPDNLGHLVF